MHESHTARENVRDPRWEWHQITSFGGDHVRWVRGRCLHAEVVPVQSGGSTVAHLCRTCDQQLPEEWHGPLADGI